MNVVMFRVTSILDLKSRNVGSNPTFPTIKNTNWENSVMVTRLETISNKLSHLFFTISWPSW